MVAVMPRAIAQGDHRPGPSPAALRGRAAASPGARLARGALRVAAVEALPCLVAGQRDSVSLLEVCPRSRWHDREGLDHAAPAQDDQTVLVVEVGVSDLDLDCRIGILLRQLADALELAQLGGGTAVPSAAASLALRATIAVKCRVTAAVGLRTGSSADDQPAGSDARPWYHGRASLPKAP